MLPLSVIIPTHNRADLLDKTLHSLTYQSKTDFPIILVDHGSTDDTEAVYRKYKDRLRVSYYKIPREGYAPAVARDFGVKKIETPLLVFLDCGTVVPTRYIEAHMAFHHRYTNYVGIGLRHGYRDLGTGSQYILESAESYGDLAPLLGQKGRDQAEAEIPLHDVRTGIDLENACMPWYFGWTTNLSLPKEAYLSAGGFNLELKGWGYEDIDLCYKLYKQGLKFAFVQDGWSIELPQSRLPYKERLENGRDNMFHCYQRQRSLALESLLLAVGLLRKAIAAYRALPTTSEETFSAVAGEIRTHFQYFQQAEDLFRYLTKVGQERVACPPIPDRVRSQLTQPTLFIGGTGREAEDYDYLTLIDENYSSTPSVWSCCGILIPLPDQSLGTVIVSDIWKRLDWTPSYAFALPGVSLLEFLISEIQRAAKKAVFLDSLPASPDCPGVSVETLESLCKKYGLPFEIVSLSQPVGAKSSVS
ncbi:MAG TPA: glycosyltransferase [Ktedonobacteraceae bacterium]|jgi:glycosyltransferase involved in cell wall biosynthesis|nr:glycosyltransferase [Ktedonobacteraceae bacterium]